MAAEFGGGHVDGSGVHRWTVAELADPEVFRAWVSELAAQERGVDVPEGWVAASLRWVTEGDEVVATIALRHGLTDFLLQEGGHIGYAVRPTARRRGVATPFFSRTAAGGLSDEVRAEDGRAPRHPTSRTVGS